MAIRNGSRQKREELRSQQDENVYWSWLVPATLMDETKVFSDAVYLHVPGVSLSKQGASEGQYRRFVKSHHA